MKVRYTRTRSLGGFRGGFHGGDGPAVTEQKVVELPAGVDCPPDAAEVPGDTPVSDWTDVSGSTIAGGTE